jgi:protein-S-isoprenylcysteine O-methyltransferase Ste14
MLGSMVLNHTILVVLWTIYFSIHSILADDKVKSRIGEIVGKGIRFYRIVYNLIATVGLLLILIWNGYISTPYLYGTNTLALVVALTITTIGLVVIKRSFREYKMSEFIGLKAMENPDKSLYTKGILSKIRHPIYTGTILIVLGFLIYRPNLTNLISSLCVFVYLIIGIRLEEKRLLIEFGSAYNTYKKKVPMLFPKIKIN